MRLFGGEQFDVVRDLLVSRAFIFEETSCNFLIPTFLDLNLLT